MNQAGDVRAVMDSDGVRISERAKIKRFHIDGRGPGPEGKNSGWAWVYIDRGKQRVEYVDGLTSNEAEYGGLVAVLNYVAFGSIVEIATDSQLVCNQFNQKWRVREPRLHRLLQEAFRLIEEKQLDVAVRWIPRRENLAGRLL